MTTHTIGPVLEQLEVDSLKEHPDNPRKHFSEPELADLAANIRQVGILVPLLVRKNGSGYQVLAGARRFRAATRAGLETVPAIVRDLDDAAALELMVLDNLQRADLHPLEEAAGFQQLMKVAHYDVARVAERVGRSVKYVYDRVKLLELVPEAKKIFNEGVITAGHAILLARLKPADQKRAIDPNELALLTTDHGLFPEDKGEEKDHFKPKSVRELQAWIDGHVRFDHTKPPDPMLFPETASSMEGVEKVIPITTEHYIPQEARDKSRIYGPRSWKRADGIGTTYDYRTGKDVKSKTCDRSQLGVIVVGEGRGDAFQVCISKACEVHFPTQAKKAKKRAAAAGGNAEDREKAEREAREKAQQLENEKRSRWIKARPAVLAAIGAKLKTATPASLADLLIRHVRRYNTVKSDAVPRGRTAEDLVRHLAFLAVCGEVGNEWHIAVELPRAAKQFGVDATKILNQVAPVQTPAAAKGKPAKRGGKR